MLLFGYILLELLVIFQLQLHLTHRGTKGFRVHDTGCQTATSAGRTYVPGPDQVSEGVCAENIQQYYTKDEADVPRAAKPDF